AEVRSMPISFLVCPSYPGWSRVESDKIALTTYAGCHHDVEAPIDSENHGMLFLNSSLRFSDVLDGSSQTLLLGEFLPMRDSLGWVSGTRATLRNTGTAMAAASQAFRDSEQNKAYPGPLVVGGFASSHPGGCLFALGDGSVHFLNESLDAKTYQRLGHRADGELILESF
ncbi:MAG: DUF1559 domain-containing protein, partial [Planctomycetales bacterium]|nr:DUF1559 domain-containing protein [Planctomycetales bacterium]